MIAIAAKIGERTVASADADAFARQLADASRAFNFAAADAGYGVFDGDGYHPTCEVQSGLPRPESDEAFAAYELAPVAPPTEPPEDDEARCGGYYVNYESHTSTIETRVIRAMLTALPTERARKFLANLGKGDLLTSLLDLAGTMRVFVNVFHDGAGVYRSGTETFAAISPKCAAAGDPSYPPGATSSRFRQEWMTIYDAAKCLGLSQKDLFDRDSMRPDEFPGKVDPSAFHAVFRIARAACVALPVVGNEKFSDYQVSQTERFKACNLLRFSPRTKPLKVELDAAPVPAAAPSIAATDAAAAPDAQPLVLAPTH